MQSSKQLLTADLVDSEDISEEAVLNELHRRFNSDAIYSPIGSILIAINPYKIISGLYDKISMTKYLPTDGFSVAQSLILPFGADLPPPHVWSIAKSAYLQLSQNHCQQAIIISGESGGKIEIRLDVMFAVIDFSFLIITVQLEKRKRQNIVFSFYLPCRIAMQIIQEALRQILAQSNQ